MALRVLAIFAMLVSLLGLARTADEKKPTEKIDWSAWVDHSSFVGEVSKIEKDGSFTLSQKKTQMMPPTRPGGGRPTQKTITTKQQMTFTEQGLLRYKELPAKLNDKGKKVPYTPDEMKELRAPTGAPGYATDRSSLALGQMVEVSLVRPKTIKPADVAPQDLRVKYALILSTPAATEKPADPKKDGKKDDKKDKKDEKKDDKKP